ncbi:MAG: thioredoxin-disulfide reductase [Oligoflexales bacterium]|nr:thioredoxin-disulfide reductase [Oligoflexales bacterium]
MEVKIYDVAIIGSGPAGLTAGIYAGRAALSTIIIAGLQPGGQLTTTTEIENFPGFPEGIMGPKLMEDMTAQAQRFGAEVRHDVASGVDFSGKIKKIFVGDEEIAARSVIISTGASARTLGIPREAELIGKGISTCATCDGFFYRNKKVAVVGGGDSALEEAMYLSKICSEVLLIHRRSSFRASKIMEERARKSPKIKMMIPYVVEEPISDNSGLTGIRVRNLDTQKIEDVRLDGLFYGIGHKPNSDMFKDYVELDENGYIKVSEHTKTKTYGVFAAGDIADPKFRQAITAAGMGCQAAIQAQHYLSEIE